MLEREGRRLTIREAYAEASSFLRQSGVGEPESNAERLLEHVLGETRSGMLLRWAEPFPAERESQWRQLLARKAAGEPVQYIIGEQEFYGLPFRVGPAVLIPRPETELLVEEVVRLGRQLWPGADKGPANRSAAAGEERQAAAAAGPPVVCDVGTGSGAIAVVLAAQCPGWRVLGSDISAAALETAKDNAARLGVADRIEWAEGDLLRPWIERGVRIDILVSNPPYIPEEDEAGLQPEVRLFEPPSALYGGEDGLVLYRRMIAQLAELPAFPRIVAFEVGMGQAEVVQAWLRQAGEWEEVRIIDDLAGIGRHVIAWHV
ncbi:release factor glutamine methyltransferase [Paenibacillus sp. UNCCL117]|uniref:peptide chain release factor N(5)-glutamine methyltransferase n=1 Tax=unclassified Paenibacillus TaxID=185978 RepID=UPI00087FA1E3|nr:release factor glutamine methyltransferase [Paenibacillus sp. cl123]SFW63996.1 release factor glutamine methyltransferase [Paenibacillus sp. UNCCL117]